MAVKSKSDKETLCLSIDHDDYSKFKIAMDKWNIKDIQSYWRFCLSFMLETENNRLWIEENNLQTEIKPAKHLLN